MPMQTGKGGLATALVTMMLLVVAATVALAATDALHGQAAGQVAVARVNGRPVSLAALMARMQQIRATTYGSAQLTEEFGRRLRREALEKLILEEVAFQEAERRGIEADPAKVEAYIAAQRAKHRDAQHFAKYLEIMGYDQESYRQHARRMVMIQEVIDQDINQAIDDVPEEVARAYYQRNLGRFIRPELVEVTDIVFFVDPDSAGDRAKVAAVRQRLVRELDGDPAALEQSDLFYVQPNIKLSPVRTPRLYEVARTLEPNAVSDIIEEDGTLHVVKLTGYQPRVETSFEDALDRIKGEVLASTRRKALEKWLADLRAKAEVEIVDMEHLPQGEGNGS